MTKVTLHVSEPEKESEHLSMEVDEEPKVSAKATYFSLMVQRILRAMGDHAPSREPPPRESGRAPLQERRVGLRSAAPSRTVALTLPNRVQVGARPALLNRHQRAFQLRCVTALSIDLKLTSDGSAIGAQMQAQIVSSRRTAPANGANTRSRGAV